MKIKEIHCKFFGHNMKRIWYDDLPSTAGKSVYAGMGGGLSLSIREVWQCSKCEFTEERRKRWD